MLVEAEAEADGGRALCCGLDNWIHECSRVSKVCVGVCLKMW